jgi:proline dehydrogenase
MGLVDFKNVAIAYERKSNQDLRKMTWLFKMMSNKNFVVLGSQLTLLAFKLRLPIKGVVKQTIFQQFCGGTTFKECQKTINELEAYNVGTILDYGAEGKKNDAAFDLTVTETIKALEFAATNTAVPVVSCKVTGLTYFELLEKITAAKR